MHLPPLKKSEQKVACLNIYDNNGYNKNGGAGFLRASPRRLRSSATPFCSKSRKVTSISSSLLWIDCHKQKGQNNAVSTHRESNGCPTFTSSMIKQQSNVLGHLHIQSLIKMVSIEMLKSWLAALFKAKCPLSQGNSVHLDWYDAQNTVFRTIKTTKKKLDTLLSKKKKVCFLTCSFLSLSSRTWAGFSQKSVHTIHIRTLPDLVRLNCI